MFCFVFSKGRQRCLPFFMGYTPNYTPKYTPTPLLYIIYFLYGDSVANDTPNSVVATTL